MREGRAPNGTSYRVLGIKGPWMALVHGLGNRKETWRFQADALSQHFRVIIFDLYGHGTSADPPAKPNLSLFSNQLSQLLDHLRVDTVAVVGFSLGGMIARRFAIDFPSRIWALGILHSAHVRDQAAHDAIQFRVHQAREHGPKETVEAALVRWFSEQFRVGHPEIMDEVRGWILANRREIYADIYQVLVDGVAELVAPKPPISVPTLVMTGDEDYGNSPEMSRALAAEIPGAQLVVLPGLRHMAKIEAPDLFNRHLLDFLLKERPHG